MKRYINMAELMEEIKKRTVNRISAEPEADKDRHSQTRIPMNELVQYR